MSSVAEYKLKIFEQLMNVNSEAALIQINEFLKTFIKEFKRPATKKRTTESTVANQISFEEWNKQFTNFKDLNEYIPEYGMTVGEYRKEIFEAEMGETRPIEEFQTKLKRLYEMA